MTDEMLQEVFATNTFGLMYCMREEKGSLAEK